MTQSPAANGNDEEAIDHDRLFKELLTTFFVDFVALFLPDVSAYLDRASLEFLDKEIFTDIHSGEKHIVDVLVKAKFKGEETFFLIHVENQASSQAEFSRRMFRYFARLYEKYNLPIYPVVIFSYDAPKRAEPKQHVVTFPGLRVLDFRYKVIQLNRLPWRRFVNQPNPVAAALMTRMNIASSDRRRVKLQCLRLLLTLQLDPAKSDLIFLFMETYLRLNTDDERWYQRAVATLAPPEKESAMELMSSFRKQGREEGRQEGLQEGQQKQAVAMLLRLLQRKFGSLPDQLQQRVGILSTAQADELTLALLDDLTVGEVEARLGGQA